MGSQLKEIFLKLMTIFPAKSVWAVEWSDKAKNEAATLKDLEYIFARILNVFFGFAGLALLVMFIVGGFSYLTAGDNPKAAEKARNTLTFAVIGLVVILLAWFIMKFLVDFTGLNLMEFKVTE